MEGESENRSDFDFVSFDRATLSSTCGIFGKENYKH